MSKTKFVLKDVTVVSIARDKQGFKTMCSIAGEDGGIVVFTLPVELAFGNKLTITISTTVEKTVQNVETLQVSENN